MKDAKLNIDVILKDLRKQGNDNSTIEVKSCAKDLSKDVWESVSAFANTSGGLIILGVSEEEGFAPVENFQIDKVRDQFINGMGDGGSEGFLTNPPEYQIERYSCEGGVVLAIDIDELELSQKPCFITKRGMQGGSYKRIDDEDIRLSPNEIYSLQSAAAVDNSDRMPVNEATVADLDEAIYETVFTRALSQTPRSLRGANTVEDRLKRLNFTDAEGCVIRAGLLVAGVYPQQFFPKLHVDVAVHPGTEKSIGGALRFRDRVICEGTLGEMIEDALTAVTKNLRRETIIEGAKRSDVLELPETVLREGITNALIHRSYNERFDGEAVAIDIFDDRVEITSPGGLWGKSKKDLTDGRSCCRNATVMRLMSLASSPNGMGSLAEGNGSGILLMMNEMQSSGLKAPEFVPRIDHFKVILWRPSEKDERQRVVKIGKAFVEAFLKENGEMSMRELAEESGMTLNQVRRRVNELIDQGRVEATAPTTSRNRKYRLKK